MHTNFDVERWAFSDNRSAHHSSLLILFIANVLYPLNRLIQRFLNSDMSHRGRRRSAVPMPSTNSCSTAVSHSA